MVDNDKRYSIYTLRKTRFMHFNEYIDTSKKNLELLGSLEDEIEQCVSVLIDCTKKGGTVFFCGNGGSAADSQHLAAGFMGRVLRDRKPLSAVALTVDTSALTAIGNDYGYDNIFSRQLEGLGKEGDVLYAISTSGNSKNVLSAIEVAKQKRITTIGLTGIKESAMSEECDLILKAPSDATNYIQEMHIIIGHYICSRVEDSIV